jgi:D-glycero-D-manno-heptose 1,7-bisphosphate phosphatase
MRRAAFIDRDGTLIVERDYLADPDGVEFVPGAVEALRRLRDAGFAIVVVTNQSGIARGLYTEDDFRAVQRRIEELLRAQDVVVDRTYWCPHHPDFTGPCDCRKPGTGMHRRAAAELGLALSRSAFVGDRLKDVLPAGELGGTGILVRTGYGEEEAAGAPGWVTVVDDLAAASELLLSDQGRPAAATGG